MDTQLSREPQMTIFIDAEDTAELSPYLFGHNLEHTRAAVGGGLSAQMLRNRKFCGKPSPYGIASEWEGIGDRAFFRPGGENPETWEKSASFRKLDPFTQRVLLEHVCSININIYCRWISDGKRVPVERLIALSDQLTCGGLQGVLDAESALETVL